MTMCKWQKEWESGSKRSWTRKLIPDVIRWVERKHEESDYRLNQALAGNGNFAVYL